MKRLTFLLAVASLSACGDNSRSRTCGAGTVEEDGVCVPEGSLVCTDGTILDPDSNSCVIDPNACQGGTVLIGNQCVDPTDGLVVDVTEAAEPNGAGVIEDSTEPAGVLELKPIGEKLVIKGNTNPFRDVLGGPNGDGQLDPDYDTYFFEVTAPTLLQITSDGVGGTASAFLVLPVQASNPLTDRDWIRYGLNVTGDMSKRQVFIPAPGVYALTFADTRSLYIDGSSPPAAGFGGAAGSPDAFYYATVEQLAIPAPTAIELTDGEGTVDGSTDGTIKFYSAPMGTGLASIRLDGDGVGTEVALAVTRNSTFKDAAAGPARILTLGFRPSDTTVIAADYAYHYALAAEPFTLTIRTTDATPLADGASSTVVGASATDIFNFSVFYYDIDATDAIAGMNVQWSEPVTGFILDENTNDTARFTDGIATRTFTAYNGLIRHRTAGRHYFFVLAPGADPGDTLTATQGDVVLRTPTAITKGTPLNAGVDADFTSTAFTYAPASNVDGWQQFLVSGTGTGAVSVRYFNAATAYGRLDNVTTTGGAAIADTSVAFNQSFAQGATVPRGRVLADDNVATYLVLASTTTRTGGAELDIEFARRDNYTDVTLVAGTPQTFSDQLVTATGGVQRYLVRTTENKLNVHLTPDGTELDAIILSLVRDESDIYDGIDDGLDGEEEQGSLRTFNAWTALEVTPWQDLTADETFELTLEAVAPFYTVSAGTTAFADACEGGTTHTFLDDPFSPWAVDDDGMTAAIPLPSSFQFYGDDVDEIYASTNGMLSFTQLDESWPFGADIWDPNDGINHIVAPYWVDLGNVVLCTKTIGTKFVVQWTGGEWDFFGLLPVQFQAILDSATNTIELVYGPDQDQFADGLFSVVGVENEDGTWGQTIPDTVVPGTSRLLTPTP